MSTVDIAPGVRCYEAGYGCQSKLNCAAIRESDIAVAVNDGVVTLTGFVRSYRRTRAVEAAAKRAVGVVGVANDIEVRLPLLHQRPDPVIAPAMRWEHPHDSPHSQMAPNMCAKRGWAASIWANRLMSGSRRKSVMFGMSS